MNCQFLIFIKTIIKFLLISLKYKVLISRQLQVVNNLINSPLPRNQNMKNQLRTSQEQETQNFEQVQRSNNLLSVAPERRQKKRKLSNMFKRVFDTPTKSRQHKNVQQQKPMISKSKIDRKDTRQTDPTQSQIHLSKQYISKNDKMNDLIQKSQNDPFLRRKLKNMMQNDLKSLIKLNNATGKFSDSSVQNIKLNNSEKKQSEINSSILLDKEIHKLPKDISMALNNSCTGSLEVSYKSLSSQTPLQQRIFTDFTDQDSFLSKNNQTLTRSNFTTFRQQNYRNKISRLQSMRQVKPVQKQQQLYTPQTFISNYGEGSIWDQFDNFNIKDKK